MRILKNFLALLTADVLSKLLALLSIGYLTRTLEPGAFGQIAFAESLLLGALLASDFGLEWYGIREIARARASIRDTVALLLPLRILLFGIAAGVFALVPVILRKPADVRMMIWLFGLSLIPIAVLLEWVFCGLERMEVVGFARVLRSGLFAVMVLALVKTNAQAASVPLYYFVAASAAATSLLGVYIRRFGVPQFRWQPCRWRTILPDAVPFAFNSVMLRGYYSLSMVLLALYVSDAALGMFSAAYKSVLVLVPLGGYAMTAVFPTLARAGSMPSHEFHVLARRLIGGVVVCAAPVVIGSVMSAHVVMGLLFGPGYARGGDVFQLLATSLLLMWLSMAYSTILMATDHTVRFMIGVLGGLVVNAVLSSALVPARGVEGAAWSILLGQGASILAFWFSLPSSARFVPWEGIGIAILAGGAMVWAILSLRSSAPLLQMAVGLTAYLGTCVLYLLARRMNSRIIWRSEPDTVSK